jgi:hypothetical protein
MATKLTEKTTGTTQRVISGDVSRATNPIRRYGPIVGALVAVTTAATILAGTILPSTAPRATALPPMSNSFGYYDHLQATRAPQLPVMSNSLGFWDRIQSPAQPAVRSHSEALAFQPAPTTAALPPMSNSLGFWDRIQSPAQLPPMSNSFGYWDHIAATTGH